MMMKTYYIPFLISYKFSYYLLKINNKLMVLRVPGVSLLTSASKSLLYFSLKFSMTCLKYEEVYRGNDFN